MALVHPNVVVLSDRLDFLDFGFYDVLVYKPFGGISLNILAYVHRRSLPLFCEYWGMVPSRVPVVLVIQNSVSGRVVALSHPSIPL